jgi:motility quorum-sensing regulator/GCU-specific mRNA interferase toxin|tara:strand:+ start:1522 stop:1827 length:306 start_codon:yes stop_codon:yes gene_type:complete
MEFMEKSTPHCKLTVVKALINAGKVRATHSARMGATALGLELSDMLGVVMALTPSDFYKSMTTHADHTVWQDVYRPSTQAGDVYLKLTVIDDLLIVSFKEL